MRGIFVAHAFRNFLLSLALLFVAGCHVAGSKPVFDKSLFLGEGREWRNYPVVVDFNLDGRLDIVATQRRPVYENSLRIWLAASDGGFKEVPQTWTSPGYSGLAVADINSDGLMDIVGGSHFDRIHTFIGKKDGALGEFVEYILHTPDGYISANVIDLNADGQLELVMLGNEKAGIEIYNFETNGGWILQKKIYDGHIGRDLAILDYNKDGRLDFVVSFGGQFGVWVLLQDQDGNFKSSGSGPEEFESANGEFHNVALADFNNDNKLDVALNGGYAGPNQLNGPDAYLAQGQTGNWISSSSSLKQFKNPSEGLALADFNRDGNMDMVVGGNSSGAIDEKAYGLYIFLGDGKGGFRLAKDSGLPENGLPRPYGIVAVDLNNDKITDIVANHGAPNEGSGYVSIWYGKPANT